MTRRTFGRPATEDDAAELGTVAAFAIDAAAKEAGRRGVGASSGAVPIIYTMATVLAMLSSTATRTAGHAGDPLTFYSVSATVIPVLFITLVFQAKAFHPPHEGVFVVFPIATLIMALTIMGEVEALKVLHNGHATETAGTFVYLALSSLALGIVTALQLDLVAPDTRVIENRAQSIALLVSDVVIFAAGFAAYLLL
jgi:hypothetical protein